MSLYGITNLRTPVDDEDAVNKVYVTGRDAALISEIDEFRREYTDKWQKSIEPILARMVIFDNAYKIQDKRILLLNYELTLRFSEKYDYEFDLLDANILNGIRTRNILNTASFPEKHNSSQLFLEEKNHERVGRYLIFKQSGKYTINFDISQGSGDKYIRIVIVHRFLSGPVPSNQRGFLPESARDQEGESWAKYNITEESSEKTIHVSDGDTIIFKVYSGMIFGNNSRIQIYYNFS